MPLQRTKMPKFTLKSCQSAVAGFLWTGILVVWLNLNRNAQGAGGNSLSPKAVILIVTLCGRENHGPCL